MHKEPRRPGKQVVYALYDFREAILGRADLREADLRLVRCLILDDAHTRGTKFDARAKDP